MRDDVIDQFLPCVRIHKQVQESENRFLLKNEMGTNFSNGLGFSRYKYNQTSSSVTPKVNHFKKTRRTINDKLWKIVESTQKTTTTPSSPHFNETISNFSQFEKVQKRNIESVKIRPIHDFQDIEQD